MISSFKLPLNFDKDALKEDLLKFSAEDWIPHFNTSYYEGDWSGIALRVAKNSPLALYPDPVADSYEDSSMLARCDYVSEVLKSFKCELEVVRFLRLSAGAKILEHRDYKLAFEDGVARLHIPVVTNAQVEFFLDGQLLKMSEGETWYLNLNLKHRVNNFGTQDRVHLVLDCVVNDWLKDIINEQEM